MRRSFLLFPSLGLLALTALTAAPTIALGDGGGGAGGSGGAGGTTTSTTSTTSTTATTGTGGGPTCVDNGLCDTPVEDCTCADCAPLALCHEGQCIPDSVCDLKDACICADCHTNPFCSDVSHCVNDGTCDTFSEGCVCADCAGKTECAGVTTGAGSTSSTTSASGSGGSGGEGGATGFVPSEDPSGCALRPSAGTTAPALGLAFGLSVLALVSRRRRS
ncbi:MAG: hypothetical protein ABI193_21855 [Minicystis sp.]